MTMKRYTKVELFEYLSSIWDTEDLQEWLVKEKRAIRCKIKLGRIDNPTDRPIDLNHVP